MAEKAGTEASECAAIDACKPGEASLDAHTAPAPTEGITSVELASGAVVATAAKPEALEPRAKNTEWSELQLLPPPRAGPGKPGLPPREASSTGMCRHGLEVLLPPPQEGPSEGQCGPQWAP